MNSSFKDFLSYNKRERNGIIVLLAIILCLLVYLNYDPDPVAVADENLESFADRHQELTSKEKKSGSIQEKASGVPEQMESRSEQPTISGFDPNMISDEGWEAMGLKEWQISGIRKYMKKAGKFKSKEDFKKLRVINDKLYKRLEPFILIEGGSGAEKGLVSIKEYINRNGNINIELNAASIKDLQSLKGIGPVLSERIVKYRDWMGGFYKKEQILEVYGIEDSLYMKIKDHVKLDPVMIKQININKAMTEVLKKHPYIKWRIANAIVNYRDQHGLYKDVSEIKNTDLVNDELYRKIAPYFSLE
ncbi:MAG TPA: hypothetical protein EYN89_08665 [Flavobacteriales bacterium]|nr:hypothetical protein [Flavobacteriales bacterium]